MVPKFLICFIALVLGAIPLCAQNFSVSELLHDIGGVGDLAARDFDADGDIDLMVASWWPGEAVYYDRVAFDSLHGYAVYVSGGAGRNIAAGDFDDDGDLDAVMALWDDARYAILRNTSSAIPQTRFSYELFLEDAGGPYACIAADISGDGEIDLITSELRNATNQVRVFEQLNGTLEEVWLSSLPYDPLGLDAADIDGDGVLEILIAANTEGGVYVMRRTQSGNYTLTQEISGFSMTSIKAIDIDADGAMDILGCDIGADRIRRWERSGGSWVTSVLPGGIMNPRDIAIVDLNTDDLLDVAVTAQGANNSGGGVNWWRQTAAGTFVMEQLSDDAEFMGLEVTDYDLDGDLDLLAANWRDERIMLFRNLMGTPTRIMGDISSARGGSPVSEARVTVDETGSSALTDAQGHYEIGIVEGTFTLRIEHPCWQTAVVENVTTQTDDTTFVDAQLQRPVIELPVTSLNLFLQNEISTEYLYEIFNSGDAPLLIEVDPISVAPSIPWITVSSFELEIAPGTSDNLTVTFTPDTSNDAAYEYLGELFLRTNSCPDTEITVAIVATVLDAPEHNGILPLTTSLAPAYPNPFNASVNLPVEIAFRDHYTLTTYDVLGRRVAELYNGPLSPGHFVFQWQASGTASGFYIAVLESARGRWESSLTLIK